MSDSQRQKNPKTHPASAGGPPPPPKKTARGLEDESPEEPHIDFPDPVVVRDLASALRQKPFKIIADLMEAGQFANVHATVAFNVASKVARKYGFYARRIAKGRCTTAAPLGSRAVREARTSLSLFTPRSGGVRSAWRLGATQNRGLRMNAPRFFLAIGVGIVITGCDSRQQPSAPDATTAGATPAEVQRRETTALEANWTLVSVTTAGETVETSGGSIIFVGDKMIMKVPAEEITTYLYRIDPLAEPKTIEMTDAQDTNAPPRFAI